MLHSRLRSMYYLTKKNRRLFYDINIIYFFYYCRNETADMMTLAVLVLLFGLQMASAMCPERCKCDDVKFTAVCIKAGLEVMPNTLNPRLKTIIYKYNNFPTVDVSLRWVIVFAAFNT